MFFIGRETELNKLEEEFRTGHSFVVIYGRRRIGKTALVQEFIKNKRALYYLATEENDQQGMQHLQRDMEEFCGHPVHANHWLELFRTFAEESKEETKVLVLDEFQYLVQANPAFASIFQKAWDEILSKAKVMVIICTYISMMTRMTLSSRSPLYGRRTAQIRLAPLPFLEIYNHFRTKSFSEMVEIYSVTGGVPKYLEFFDNENTLEENVQETILSKSGFLYEEPNFLLNKEVKEPLNYFSIMKVIAQEKHKLSEIGAAMGVESSRLTPYLETLRELYLVEKRVPVTETNPEKSRKGLYSIRDLFIRFWFKFIFPNKSELEMNNLRYVQEKLKRNFIDNHVSFVYEEVCREIFLHLCMSGQIEFHPSLIGGYWSRTEEIDIVAINRESKRLFAGECKYFKENKPVGLEVYMNLLKKCENRDFAGYEISYGIFSKSGFSPALREIAREDKRLLLINEQKLLR